MRLTTIACSILLLSGLAAAQANIIGGTASDWAPPYIYAAPFVPLITTPSVSWGPAVPTSAGARNATWGNVAGARNSTTETLPAPVYDRPWHENGFRQERIREVRVEGREGRNENERERIFRSGVATTEFSEGLAQLVNKSSSATKASRTYTNQDVVRMNDANGTVKYDGKTEHL
jgi:hypothetical protein